MPVWEVGRAGRGWIGERIRGEPRNGLEKNAREGVKRERQAKR